MLTAWFDAERHFGALEDFRRQVDELFQEFESGRRGSGTRAGVVPRAALYDNGDALVLQLELPGVSKDELTLSSTQESLQVEGRRQIESPKGYSVHRQERHPYEFSRTFSFPVKVDTTQIDAELKHGLLTVTLPKLPELKPKNISVRAG